jgi:hypothetical protein
MMTPNIPIIVTKLQSALDAHLKAAEQLLAVTK